jgi:predicted nucleic acid-binding protein
MWVVDTCVMLDVFEHDPKFGQASAMLLDRLLSQGLAVSPVTMVELSPAFDGDLAVQKRFFDEAGIVYGEPWTAADTEAAHAAWNAFVAARRESRVGKRPVADILIGAFAANRSGLITRNAADFTRWFPRLKVRQP